MGADPTHLGPGCEVRAQEVSARLRSPAAEKGCLSNVMFTTLLGDTAVPRGPEDSWEPTPPSEAALGSSVLISQA